MRRRLRALPPVACLAILVALACGQEAPASEAIAPAELAARLGSETAPRVLDVRTPEEYAAGHVPAAVNIPVDQLALRLAELDAGPDEEIVVHCERGGRAQKAEVVLREAGFTRVRDLTGHMQAWRAAGLPVE